jgi:hypothetical protein
MVTMTTKHKNTGHLTGLTVRLLEYFSTLSLLTFPSQLAAKPGAGLTNTAS